MTSVPVFGGGNLRRTVEELIEPSFWPWTRLALQLHMPQTCNMLEEARVRGTSASR